MHCARHARPCAPRASGTSVILISETGVDVHVIAQERWSARCQLRRAVPQVQGDSGQNGMLDGRGSCAAALLERGRRVVRRCPAPILTEKGHSSPGLEPGDEWPLRWTDSTL